MTDYREKTLQYENKTKRHNVDAMIDSISNDLIDFIYRMYGVKYFLLTDSFIWDYNTFIKMIRYCFKKGFIKITVNKTKSNSQWSEGVS